MPKPTLSKTTTVKAIFTNVLFVLGVILMVIGFVWGMSTVAKFAFFDVYPLNSYEETRCELGGGYYPEPTLTKLDGQTEMTTQEKAEQEKKIDEQKQRCLRELERARSVKKVEDIVSPISFFVAGLALTMAFKQFIFGKK